MAVMISRAGSASFSAFAASALAFAACAGTKPPDPVMEPHGVTVELSELEIHGDGIDRFVRCPPSGSLGQSWIPARVTEEPHDASLTERAIEQMLKPFRSCYTKGTLHRPDTEGRAAIVLRTGSNGKSTVENYATCGLAGEVVQCMITEAAHGMAPAPGTVVVIPSVFAPRGGYAGTAATAGDAYAASAHLVLEDARPGLHSCDENARSEQERHLAVEARGVFALDLDARGHVVKWGAEPWNGPNELRACAGAVLGKLVFPAPPDRETRIIARIAFNPQTR